MSHNTFRIATRRSPMALWQAHDIKHKISNAFPELTIELIEFVTQGDRDTQSSLVNLGGKSVFVKELQRALINHEADIAVHCIKDMSVHPVEGLMLGAVCERDHPGDAFVSEKYAHVDELPHGAVFGTGSPRRESLIRALRPDLTVKLLRGNANTRLAKLDNGDYDAIMLAVAGLERLSFQHRIRHIFDAEFFTPAIAQGALGIECRTDDEQTQAIIAHLHHAPTAICIEAERTVNQVLKGDCHTPIGAHAKLHEDALTLEAVVASLDGKHVLRAKQQAAAKDAHALGQRVAEALLAQGAAQLL